MEAKKREKGRETRTLHVHPRHLRRLAPDERTPRLLTPLRDALDDRRGELDVEPAARVVVEEVERLGALHEEVVDGHRNEVDSCFGEGVSLMSVGRRCVGGEAEEG